jgi:GTPase
MEKEERVYHIYAKGECIYHSLSEEKFTETWEMLHRMVDLLGANISVKDLEYEEVYVNKLIPLNSSY